MKLIENPDYIPINLTQTREDYYALVDYRGRTKYYRVKSHFEYDIRIEYIDYNPDREWAGVWVSKERIVESFKKGSIEYKYFNSLEKKFDSLQDALRERAKARSESAGGIYLDISLSDIKKAYKEAYKSIKKPEHINF